ncbi:zinc finger protein 318 isoform X2 [Hyla sarda]|nr:zinc finger protein 318 isoform X2 [Hyla sarda]
MPKKSILKKRMDVEPASRDQSPQVDNLSSNKDERSVSSAGAGKSVEQNSLTTDSQHLSSLPMAVKMGLLDSSASSFSASAAAQTTESPHPHGSSQPIVATTSWTLSSSAKIGMEGSVTGQNPLCEQTGGPTVSPYSSTLGNMLFNKSVPNSQAVPFSGMNVFPEHKEDSQKGPDQSSLLSKTLDPKQKRSTEIEDEERFLYGDEDDKKPEHQKASSVNTVPALPAKGSPNKQEFEKIHDLLKTIGLDIGVAEIGELAVRTQERLHGKKLVPKMSQPASEKPQSTSSANPKAEVSDPQVKTEKTGKLEAAANTKPPLKPALKETTPPVMQQNPAPVPKEKPQLILRKPLPKETPKVEIPVQPPTAPSPVVQPPTAPSPVQPPTVPLPVVQPPTVPPPVVQPPTVQPPIVSPVPDPTPPPISPSQIPVYTPYPHTPMVPRYNMPPPNYNPYTPYVSYPTSNWTMYSQMPPQQPPPQIMTPPAPHMSVPVSTPTPQYNPRSNLRVIETTEDLTEAKAAVKPDAKPTTPLAALLAKQEAERKNKESEKLKVLEELDSVRKEHKVKKENLKTLSAKVDQLRIQQGILLRKKRREKDGHKDPLLEELNNVLESALKQMTSLCEEIDTWRHKQHQLIKVAEILGVSPSDLAEKSEPKKERSPGSPSRNSDTDLRTNSDSSKSANDLKANNDQTFKADVKAKSISKSGDDTKSMGTSKLSSVTKSEDVKVKATPPRQSPNHKNSPEPRSPYLSKSDDVKKSRDKSRSKSPRPCSPSSKKSSRSEEPPPFRLSEIFEFYDSGSHWCEDCNAICLTLSEFLLHLHDKKHNQCVKEEQTPWVKKTIQGMEPKKQKVNIPLKGSEFMVPVSGYYCNLCKELFPDHISAEEHLRAYAHNDKYKKHTDVNIDYEKQRREKKKASLMAAQEASRILAEQKRKLADQKHEAHEHSRSKKAKKEEHEEERKSKSKHHASASPPSSNQKRNKMPEKESQKNQRLNKTPENESSKNQKCSKTPEKEPKSNQKCNKTPEKEPMKNQKRNKTPEKDSSKNQKRSKTPEKEPSKNQKRSKTPEKEPPKNPSLKFFWKTSENKNPAAVGASVLNIRKEEEPKTLSLKPKGFAIKLLGKSSTLPGNALSPSHSVTPTTVTSAAPATSAASSSPTTSTSQTKVRPNLPSVVNVRAATPAVTMSKPAPLNTFLSIKSSNSTSKSLPVVKNKPTSVNQEDMVSKALGGGVLLKDSTHPESTDKPANKDQEETTVKSPKVVHIIKKQDYLFNVLVSKKEIIENDNKEVKSEKESPGSKNPQLPFSQKSGSVSTSTSGPDIQVQSSGSNVQQTQNAKSPVQNPASSPVSSTAPVKFSISSSINSSFNNAKADSTSNQQTGKAELITIKEESGVQAPPQAKASSQLEKETPKEVKASAFSINPVTGRFEYLPVQETKPKDTNIQKVPETKSMSIAVSHVSSVKPNKPASTPLVPMMKPRSTFNATTRLNQKFKKAPLSLPSSLFGHIQDTGCKDIKITSVESQKTNLLSPVQNKSSPGSWAKPSPVNPSTMQQELDSYYKLIATEEDPEDLTTSEDQDSEVAPQLMNVVGIPHQTKEECPPDKVKLEREPPVQAPIIPDDSGEDLDDSDMACEVPDVSLNSLSGWNFMQSSYASSKVYGSSNQQPWNLASENRLIIQEKSTIAQVTTVANPENSMEDLSVYVTCDSD